MNCVTVPHSRMHPPGLPTLCPMPYAPQAVGCPKFHHFFDGWRRLVAGCLVRKTVLCPMYLLRLPLCSSSSTAVSNSGNRDQGVLPKLNRVAAIRGEQWSVWECSVGKYAQPHRPRRSPPPRRTSTPRSCTHTLCMTTPSCASASSASSRCGLIGVRQTWLAVSPRESGLFRCQPALMRFGRPLS